MKRALLLLTFFLNVFLLNGCDTINITSSPTDAYVYLKLRSPTRRYRLVGRTPYSKSEVTDFCAAYVVWPDGIKSKEKTSFNAPFYNNVSWHFVKPQQVIDRETVVPDAAKQ